MVIYKCSEVIACVMGQDSIDGKAVPDWTMNTSFYEIYILKALVMWKSVWFNS